MHTHCIMVSFNNSYTRPVKGDTCTISFRFYIHEEGCFQQDLNLVSVLIGCFPVNAVISYILGIV